MGLRGLPIMATRLIPASAIRPATTYNATATALSVTVRRVGECPLRLRRSSDSENQPSSGDTGRSCPARGGMGYQGAAPLGPLVVMQSRRRLLKQHESGHLMTSRLEGFSCDETTRIGPELRLILDFALARGSLPVRDLAVLTTHLIRAGHTATVHPVTTQAQPVTTRQLQRQDKTMLRPVRRPA
jgi:hypothetical protein